MTTGTIPSRPDRMTRKTYLGVLVVEVIVVVSIWIVQRYFGN